MATKSPLVRLRHIEDEIVGISAALEGVDRTTFVGDYVLRRASERALLIIAEAVKSLPPGITDRYPDMDWPGIVALGNILRHEYQTVDAATIFEILSDKLPELALVVGGMIRELEGG